jgi:oligopeptide transport system permease protein
MINYILKRLVLVFITLFIILTLSFFLIKLLPDNTEMSYLMQEMTPDDYRLMRQRWGYDQPLFVQYFYWLKNIILHWDWGVSTHKRIGVNTFTILTEKLPITMRLNLISLVFSIPLGLLFGIVAALRKKQADRLYNLRFRNLVHIHTFIRYRNGADAECRGYGTADPVST